MVQEYIFLSKLNILISLNRYDNFIYDTATQQEYDMNLSKFGFCSNVAKISCIFKFTI